MHGSRRKVLKYALVLAGVPLLVWLSRHWSASLKRLKGKSQSAKSEDQLTEKQIDVEMTDQKLAKREESLKDQIPSQPVPINEEKIKAPDRDYADDLQLSKEQMPILRSTVWRLAQVQKEIGFGYFNLVAFDRALKIAKSRVNIGEFEKEELDFLDEVFHRDARECGFMGEKVVKEMTYEIPSSSAVKIPYTGHFLFTGDSHNFYKKVQRDVGDALILTSGIRSQIKQTYLFLAKAQRVNGNLARASRSLAPPGYSFHGSGDFDVGKVGLGARNFSEAFAETEEFKRLTDLGYVSIRYYSGNRLGVRYEPWHVKLS